jgi:hypothetical protein
MRCTLPGTRDAETSAEYEEAVLRFFAFLDRYHEFGHIVKDFLNSYMADHAAQGPQPHNIELFRRTVTFVAQELPHGITRGRNATPINLYEAVVVGAALIFRDGLEPARGRLTRIINDDELRRLTTAGTNSRAMVTRRIEFVRDALR